MASSSGIKQLLAEINEKVNKLVEEMEAKEVRESTFDIDSPDDYQKLEPLAQLEREIISSQLQDLQQLLLGPKGTIDSFCTNALAEVSTFNILNYFDFWNAFPLDGDASVDDLAEKTKLPRDVVRRVLNHATAIRFFDKVDPVAVDYRIRHNSHSAVMARNPNLCGEVTNMLDTFGPPILLLARALEKWSVGQESIPLEIGKLPFNYAYSGGLSGKHDTVWDFVEADGEGDRKGWRQGEMVKAMRWLKDQLDYKVTVLYKMTDWNQPANAHLVDLGGSAGYDDFSLAREYPNLRITVQDLEKCAPHFEEAVPDDLRGRVSFQAHSFLDDQPTVADFYLLKYILIDWNDVMAEKIIRALIPALRPGAKILVLELAPFQFPPGVPLARAVRRVVAGGDMRMMSLFGQSQRSADDIEKLFTNIDNRFEVVKADLETAPQMLLLELVWRG